MLTFSSLVITGLYLSGIFLLGLSVLSFWKMPKRTSISFLLLTLFTAFWAFAYAIEIATPDIQTKLIMRKIEYLGFAYVPALWFVFVSQYTGYKTTFSKKLLITLFLEPTITFALAWTNGVHHLVYKNVKLVQAREAILLMETHGVWYWVHIYYSIFLVTAAAIFVLEQYKYRDRVGKIHLGLLLAASVIPWIGDVIAADLIPGSILYLTPIFLLASYLIVAIGAWQSRSVFDLIPSARKSFIDTTTDAYMLLGNDHRILDANPAAARDLEIPKTKLIGKQILGTTDLLAPFSRVVNAQLPFSERIKAKGKVFEIKGGAITDNKGSKVGTLVTWRDVTAEVRNEDLENKVRLLDSFGSVVETINKATTLKEVYDAAIQSITSALNVEKAAVLLFDEAGVARFVAWSGLSEKYRRAAEGHSPWPPDAVNPQPVLVEDIEETTDPPLLRLKNNILTEGIRALGFIPIVHQGKLLGKFMVYYPTPHHFDQKELELAKAIAAHLGLSIEKAKLLDLARTRLRQLETIRKIDLAISSTLEPDRQIEILLSHVLKELNGDVAVLFLLDQKSRKIVPVAAKGSYNPDMQHQVSFEIGEGAVGWIVLNKRPLYIPDVRKDPRWKKTESDAIDKLISYVGVPLVVEGETIGALDVSTRYPRKFTKEEIEFLQTLAGQIAVTMKNTRLYRKLQEKVAQMEALYEVSREITAEHDLKTLLEKIVDKATTLLNTPSGGIYLYDEKKKVLRVAVAKGTDVPLNTELQLGEGMAGRVALTRRPMIVDNYSQWEKRSPKYEGKPFTAVVEVPMLHSGELIGVLVVNEIGFTGRKFTEEDAKLLSLLASHAADAVHNAKLIAELEERIERQETLYRMSAELTKLKGCKSITQLVADLLHQRMHYEYVSVVLINQETGEKLVAAVSGDTITRPGDVIPKGKGVSEKALKTRKLQYYADVTKEPAYYPGGKQSKSEVDVPIQSGDNLYGVLTIEKSDKDAFDEKDFDMLQAVANQMAIAIENAKKVERITSMLQATTKLYQASSSIASAGSAREVMERSLRSLWEASEKRPVVISIFKPPYENVSLSINESGKLEPINCKDGALSTLAHMAESTRAPFILARESLPQSIRDKKVTQALVLPLVGEKEIIGAMAVWYKEKAKIPSREMELFSTYSNQTATAIEKTISMEEIQKRSLEQEVVSTIARALNETLDVKEAFPKLVEGIRKLVRADRISIAVADEEKKHFMISVLYDKGNEIAPGKWYPVEFTAAAHDVLRGEVHITNDLADELDYPGERALYEAGHRSRVNIPLIAGTDIIGALNIVSNNPGEFSYKNLPPLLQIADVLSISIVNTRIFQREQERARELSVLYKLSRKLSTLETSAEVAKAAIEAAKESLGEDLRFRIILVGKQFRECIQSSTRETTWVEDLNADPNIARGLRENAVPWNLAWESNALSQEEKLLLFTGEGTYAHVFPLKHGSDILGAIVVEGHKPTCSDASVQSMGSIAELVSMTLRRVLLFHEVEDAYLRAVSALAGTIDAKDSYTAEHSQQLETMAVAVAAEMGLNRQEIEDLKFGAQLHDIGKIGVPDSILKKPGPLTPAEWKVMRKHPEIGEKILSPLPKLRGAAKIVRHHHERYDGKGYPDGLKGEQIPIGARILAVVDAYNAITTRRVYSTPRSHTIAIEELKRNAGTQFDPEVVKVFLKLFEKNPLLPQHIDLTEAMTQQATKPANRPD